MAEMFKVNAPVRKPLFEGVQGENEARSIVFDITPWVEELGDGAVTATAKRSQDSQPYPVTVTKDGNTVTWKPTSTDTAFAGVGSFQLEYTVDDVLAKTCIWSTMVAPSLDPAGDPPDPYDNWLAEMRQVAADALQSEQNAEDSAEDAEAWAVGQRGGVDVPSTDPTYENNAKYWAEQAEELKDSTQAIVDEARADVFEAMDGLHEDTTAGSALQLISDKYTEDQVPYLFRKSGGGKSIGNREIDKIVGGSIAWNQLIPVVSQAYTLNGITYTPDGNGGIVANGTATSESSYTVSAQVSLNSSHKYLMKGCPAGGSSNTYYISDGYYKRDDGNGYIGNLSLLRCTLTIASGVTVNNLKFVPQIFDLTQMFGTAVADRLYAMEQANAGSGVALFRSWFPKEYYAYNAGTLMSVKTSAHEMVGFNQWDEQWENGYYDTATGEKILGGSTICNKNKIAVLPNTAYFIKVPSGTPRVFYYNANEGFLETALVAGNSVFTTPSNASYMCFHLSGTTYNHDICINLSWSGWRNGEYEPYIKHTYPLDDIELRGIPKLDANGDIYFDGDTYEADGSVTRKYGIVDLGTLTWTYDATYQRFSAVLADSKNGTRDVGCVCSKYPTIFDGRAFDSSWDKVGYIASHSVYIEDSAYSTAAAFKTAMSGVYLVYELATPTTETADPFTNPQIVDAYGTERYVDERTVAVPVGHVTKYPDNLREKLDGLPWDFSNLIAPTEKAYTATRNYTAGSLLIVNNVLYKATANIANGGAITPNTNVTATTLAEIISAL